MPPHTLAYKIGKRLKNKFFLMVKKHIDMNFNTHIKYHVPLINRRYINIGNLKTQNLDSAVVQYLSKMYLSHRFDLLGSGWVKNTYDSIPLGVEGYKYDMNVKKPLSSHKLYGIRIEINEYEPIDWHKDYKSGYRWNEKTWYKDIKYGHLKGVDIKVPWELARFQHITQLAIFCLVDKRIRERCIKEFRNQVLDFIANNPPRFGVNWFCTMDVGIRVANWLIAYDIFTQIDENGILDTDFKQIFANSVYEHGLHIVSNLEYSSDLTSNHYLSNIAGLLFVSAYLHNSKETNQWLAFSIQEIINETRKQFYEDGGNFESSTSYHRLSGEMIALSTAIILGLKEDKIGALRSYTPDGWKAAPKLLPLSKQEFKIQNDKIILPQWFIDRLYKVGRFTLDILKPNGEIPQFGDNDSGRFIKLCPVGKFITNKEAQAKYLNLRGYLENLKNNNIFETEEDFYWDEKILDHRPFLSYFYGLFRDEIFLNEFTLESSFIESISNGRILVAFDKRYKQIQIRPYKQKRQMKFENYIIYNLPESNNEVKTVFYPKSGIYVFKTDKWYLAICATPLGQNGIGGHTHNDKLSFELWIDGKNVVTDPGTYLYTPLPEERNLFRSTKAHSVPQIEGTEQNDWIDGPLGLFNLIKGSEVILSDFSLDPLHIEFVLENQMYSLIRRFIISNNNLKIVDFCSKDFKYSNFRYYSNGYGRKEEVIK